MERGRWWAALAGAALLAGVGCAPTSAGPGPTPEPVTTTTAPAPPAVAADPVDVDVVVEGMAATARVGPMVQVDAEHAVLVLDVALPDDLERSAKPWELVPDSEHHPYAGLLSRLQVLDLGEAAVEEPLDVDGFTASSWFGREAGRQVGYAAYGPQTERSVAVVVPHGDVVEVPVVDLGRLTDERGPRSRKAVSEASAWLLEGDPEHGRSRGELRVRRTALEAVARDRAGTVDVVASTEEVTVHIAPEALFDDGSADPSDTADDVLDAVAAQLTEHGAESVRVVVPGDAALAHERGAAVRDRLAELADLTGTGVEVVHGAAASRVEVHLVGPTGAGSPRVAPWGDPSLPEVDGPVAGAPECAVVREEHPVTVSLEEVRELGGYLVGRVEVTNTGEETISRVGSSFVRSRTGEEREPARFREWADVLALAVGTTRHYPLECPVADRYAALAPSLRQDLAPGDTYVAAVVWPRVPGRSVVLDVAGRDGTYGTPDVRVVDVPVR